MTSSLRKPRKHPLRLAAMLGALLWTGISGLAQDIMLPSDDYTPKLKKRKIPDRLPATPSVAPAFSIPVTPLGFGAPGPNYLGRHDALVSLDFTDADHLLFTFRAPGLIHRTSDDGSREPRQMRAVVLKLPEGSLVSQTLWTVPGPDRYLWMLKNGSFLLRDREGLRIGDEKLETRSFLPLPGALVALQIDPSQKLLLTSSYEPTEEAASKSNGAASAVGEKTSSPSNIVLRIVDLGSGEVRATQRVTAASALPLGTDGHVVLTHDKLDRWSLRVNSFAGVSRVLGHVESTCLPTSFLVSEREILITGCNPAHTPKLTAVSTTGQQLWETEIPAPVVPPLLLSSPDGSLLVRETVVLNEGVKLNAQTLWIKAVKGQVVRVFDAATGKLLLETPASPAFDGGGNVAISPSGRRVAVLNDGNVQVFDLAAGSH
ncbi:MAG: hypothetical protein WCC26_04710 [Terracidiphilus sp.]